MMEPMILMTKLTEERVRLTMSPMINAKVRGVFQGYKEKDSGAESTGS